jgi:hypothetical protein|tara:strand:- start:430 stop:861 length:432 start_codon:yes stop_codon:yes gene_type:complete
VGKNMDHIFSLFSSNEEISGGNDKSYIDFKESPAYFVGMYKKLVLNNLNFNKKIVKMFKDANSDLDANEMSEAGEWVTYNRAWHYIQKINLSNEDHISSLKKHNDEYFQTTIKLGINFFEEQEQYERCALLKKIEDICEHFEK